jgi:hypothetical protein
MYEGRIHRKLLSAKEGSCHFRDCFGITNDIKLFKQYVPTVCEVFMVLGVQLYLESTLMKQFPSFLIHDPPVSVVPTQLA